MEERGVAPPFPLLPETPPPSSGAPAKIHPFPRGGWFVRQPCRLAHTQKREEALAAARLKKSDFVNKKKPERAGNRGNRCVAREGLGWRLPLIDDYIISYEKEKFRNQMLNRMLNID